jgi:hypothetical protein
MNINRTRAEYLYLGMAAGYSGNPLYKKLGLKEKAIVKTVNAPAHYKELIGDFIKLVQLKSGAKKDIDVIHFFTNSVKEFEAKLPVFKNEIKKDGAIWVSWYKKSAKKPTELDENIVRNTALVIGLVDVKVCAVDDDWSGLKLVYRLKDR